MKYNFDSDLLNILGLRNREKYEIKFILDKIVNKGWNNLNGEFIIDENFLKMIIGNVRVKNKFNVNLLDINGQYSILKKIVECFITNKSNKTIDTGKKIKVLVI